MLKIRKTKSATSYQNKWNGYGHAWYGAFDKNGKQILHIEGMEWGFGVYEYSGNDLVPKGMVVETFDNWGNINKKKAFEFAKNYYAI